MYMQVHMIITVDKEHVTHCILHVHYTCTQTLHTMSMSLVHYTHVH